MSDLLQAVIDAHGGLRRWNELKSVQAEVSIGGALWPLKGKPDVLTHIRIEDSIHEQQLTTYLID